MATGYGCGNPSCESCYGRGISTSPQTHSFRVGDYVEATCPRDNPYKITYGGWKGIVTQVTSTMIWVKAEGSSSTYDVNPRFFRLVKHGTPDGWPWETREVMSLDEAQRRFNVPRDYWLRKYEEEYYKIQESKFFLGTEFGKLIKERKPMKLSVMQKLLMAKDDQTLTKAGYLDGDMDLTEEGQEALDSILFAANKAALVVLAQAVLDEEAAEAKK